MKRLMTRPRSLLLAVALAIAAALCTVSTANAASSASETATPAPPSNLTAKAVSPTSVDLTWTNNAADQSGVVISLDGTESVDVQGATVSSYIWHNLSPGTKYWFYVASKIYGTPGDPTGYGNTQSAWVGPVYATTPETSVSTGNPNCGHPVMFGLHGMAEGPSGTIRAISPELLSIDTDQNAISGAVLIAPVSYPTIYPDKWRSLLTTGSCPIPGNGTRSRP